MNMSHNYYNFKLGRKVDRNGKVRYEPAGIPILLTEEELKKYPIKENQDYYISIYKYNNEHKKIADQEKSVAGIDNVLTNKLVWDFDSPDLEKARLDAITLCDNLITKYGVKESNILCHFSGNKGYHVEILLDRNIGVEEFKTAVNKIKENLETFDPTIFDHARVFRMPNTKNLMSGLYKIPITVSELKENTTEETKEFADSPRENFEIELTPNSLPDYLFKAPKKETKVSNIDSDFDFSTPPRGWKKYKWALAQGWFESSERHNALIILAATCRGLGYDKESTYYLCKSALKKQSARTGQEEFSKEELYENIVESVFKPGWEGGQYGTDHPLIQKICKRLNIEIDAEDLPCTSLDDLFNIFTDYSTNFDRNIIRTGIEELDENLIYSTSTLNGMLGQPGAGKTTVIKRILENTSVAGIPSMFISADMGPPIMYAKLVQGETGLAFKEAVNLYRVNKEESLKIGKWIKEKFKNVTFNFRSGLTVEQIKEIILKQTERTGVMPKLLAIDYLECLGGPYSDPTANAGFIANQLKDLATELQLCVILLLQTQKHSTPDISDPLLSMKQIKGASIIEQACSTVLTLWREGYNPNYVDDDKYISFAVVKNRFGSQWRGDFSWEPVRGVIRSLTEEELEDLKEFKKRKKEEKEASQSPNPFG
jgi:KaiC/GvpD/RAD55 family RecA-like ATPase